MELVWILLFFGVIAVSSLMAFRSMREGYEEKPSGSLSYGLFLMRNSQALTLSILMKLHRWALRQKAVFSLEKLFKGKQSAFVIFAPISITDFLPELQLFQLENYLPASENTYVWSLVWDDKKRIQAGNFLQNINLRDDQQFFWQMICLPQKDKFKLTLRAMVVDSDQVRRIDLAKNIDKLISESTGLLKQRDEINQNLYEAFGKRTLLKSEEKDFLLAGSDVLGLAGLNLTPLIVSSPQPA